MRLFYIMHIHTTFLTTHINRMFHISCLQTALLHIRKNNHTMLTYLLLFCSLFKVCSFTHFISKFLYYYFFLSLLYSFNWEFHCLKCYCDRGPTASATYHVMLLTRPRKPFSTMERSTARSGGAGHHNWLGLAAYIFPMSSSQGHPSPHTVYFNLKEHIFSSTYIF